MQTEELDLDEEISKLKSKLEDQIATANPLKYLTSLRLHIKLGLKFKLQHKYKTALKEYWLVIKNAESRIDELLKHTKNGQVGNISTSKLIDNSKHYITDAISKITELSLTNTDLANKKIEPILADLIRIFSKKIKKVSKEDIYEAVQKGVLVYANTNAFIVMANQHNMKFVLDDVNYNLLPKEDVAKLLIWFCQKATKEIKKDAHSNPGIAEQCYSFRYKSANYYKLLGDANGFYEEMSSALLYKTYTSKNREEFENNYQKMEALLLEWEKVKSMPYREPFYRRTFATIFGLNFIEKTNLRDIIINLKLVNHYLTQTKSKIKTRYILFENYYVLLAQIEKADSFKKIRIPYQKKFKFPDTIREQIQDTKQNYRDLVKVIGFFQGDKIKSPIKNPELASIYQLYSSKVISEKIVFDLIKRLTKSFFGAEIVPMDILDESDDEKLLVDMLRLGETSVTEVKKSLSLAENIGQAISALANTKGGDIIIGLEEIRDAKDYSKNMVICKDFVLRGIDTSKGTLDDQKKRLTLHLNDAGIDVHDLIIDSSLVVREKRICVIKVPNLSDKKAVFYRQELYKRVDAQNKRLSSKEAIALLSRKQ